MSCRTGPARSAAHRRAPSLTALLRPVMMMEMIRFQQVMLTMMRRMTTAEIQGTSNNIRKHNRGF